jgi:glycosyltransferase A (GT-A) superfamily protein (DUF2064 family)
MSNVGLAIFVKTPSLSLVKTRLWPRIGRRCAEAFHLASAEAVASVVQHAQTLTPLRAYWAVAEVQAMHGDIWSDLPRICQGDGGLGERMHRVHADLLDRHSAVLLIGADAPQLIAAQLVRAAEWLRTSSPRIVIGRAGDGGFWLFGSNRPLPAASWTAVEYSMPYTARDFLAAMQPHGSCLELDVLNDVDHYDDFPRACTELQALSAPSEAQQRLLAWMQQVLLREGHCP